MFYSFSFAIIVQQLHSYFVDREREPLFSYEH